MLDAQGCLGWLVTAGVVPGLGKDAPARRDQHRIPARVCGAVPWNTADPWRNALEPHAIAGVLFAVDAIRAERGPNARRGTTAI